MSERGKYIITEGTDATGKSTVSDLLEKKAQALGYETIRVDEPDSAMDSAGNILVPISSELRRIIKDGSLARSALTNVLLFTASRLENWQQVIKPALEEGVWVFGARNYLSTVVYQGYGEGFDVPTIKSLTRLALDEAYFDPDHISILDLEDESERERRLSERGPLEKPDTFESRDAAFQQRLRAGYRTLAIDEGIPIVDAGPAKDVIAETIWNQITE